MHHGHGSGWLSHDSVKQVRHYIDAPPSGKLMNICTSISCSLFPVLMHESVLQQQTA